MDEDKNKLITFLKELTTSLETNAIHPKKLQSLNEFYKMHSFLSETINNNVDNVTDIVCFQDEAKDFIKLLILAWFLYCMMKKKN
jgi:DNA polymerase II large subunit